MATVDLHTRLINTGILSLSNKAMEGTASNTEITIVQDNGLLTVCYAPKTERTIFDICDLSGRVIKTGVISTSETAVDSSDLFHSKYIMLIVDGDRMISKSFEVAA